MYPRNKRIELCFWITFISLIIILILFARVPSRGSQSVTMVYLTGSYSYTGSSGYRYNGIIEPFQITIISLLEDIDRNNEVDFTDINLARLAYGSFPGELNWNSMADIDKNGSIDFTDLNMVRLAYGEVLD